MYVTSAKDRTANSEFGSIDFSTIRGALFFTFVTAVIVALYASSLNDYFYGKGSSIKPLYIHLFTMCFAGIALLARHKSIIHKFPIAILIWIGLYLAFLLTNFLYSSQTDIAIEQLIFGLKTAALLFSFIVLLLPEAGSNVVLKILAAIVLFAVFLNLYDFVSPTYSTTYGRGAGLYENSNTAGRVITISMVLSCVVVPRRWRLAYCILAGVGILVTFSRSSWLLWAIGFTGLAATGQLFFRSRLAPAFILGSISALVIYALLSGLALNIFEVTGFDQYLTRGTITRLGGSGETLQDATAVGRIEMIGYSLSKFQEHPWIGAGLGATSEWVSLKRPHNLYLMIAVEAGIVGLLVLFALLGALWMQVNSIGRVAVILYAASSVFTHNNLEQAIMLLLLAITIVFYPKRNGPLDNSTLGGSNRIFEQSPYTATVHSNTSADAPI